MKVVAFVGADGSGKTMVARELEAKLGRPAKYIYMGVNVDASNVLLPTTWLWRKLRRATGTAKDMGRARSQQQRRRSRNPIKRFASACLRSLRLVNLVAEEVFRQCVATVYRWRGYVVLCDRDYFLDFYSHDVIPNERRTWDRAIHGFFLKRFYRRPGLVVMLDAPAETLHERKKDSSVETIESRRAEYYLAGEQVKRFQVIDAARQPQAVIDDVREAVLAYWDSGEVKSIAAQPEATDG